MTSQYYWKYKEANFGKPLKREVNKGTHITFEILIKKENTYFALRRPRGIPRHIMPPKAMKSKKGMLYFCHDLIRYGESVEKCVKRIVKDQAKVNVKNYKVVYIETILKRESWGVKNEQFAIIPCIIAEISSSPRTNKDITEVISFNKHNPPNELAWWTRKELKEFLKEYDNP